jgi:hypothetical protein
MDSKFIVAQELVWVEIGHQREDEHGDDQQLQDVAVLSENALGE